jgi:hypothetical protein
MKPAISRGNCMLETRFYFADRAVENIVLESEANVVTDILFTEANLLSSINLAIFLLVTRFINARSAFKSVVEGVEAPQSYLTGKFSNN